eukprot:scaffold80464_cov34-Prasinocladus_malaysianus.AAC.1
MQSCESTAGRPLMLALDIGRHLRGWRCRHQIIDYGYSSCMRAMRWPLLLAKYDRRCVLITAPHICDIAGRINKEDDARQGLLSDHRKSDITTTGDRRDI